MEQGNDDVFKAEEVRSGLDKLWPYTTIDRSIYLCEKKRSKEKFVCDCVLDASDLSSACGEQCMNRMLFIECVASKCPCGKHCTNRRMQLGQCAHVELFKTEKKGYGLLAAADIPSGSFVYEYVGEICDTDEFERRADQYANEMRHHYYFMSLDSDSIIDATQKGALSRFINHSCDPNCETQKWTVNGELRIGFFSIKPIAKGEEVTFDYQYERYGEKDQACYCGAAKCRGTLGARRESTSSSAASKGGQGKRRRRAFDPLERLRDQLRPLTVHGGGLRDDETALTLLRLMVAETRYHNPFLEILKDTSSVAILNRFVHLKGLDVLRIWLGETDPPLDPLDQRLALDVVGSLPVHTRNVVTSSKMDAVLEGIASSEVDLILSEKAKAILERWASLETVYVIPREAAKSQTRADTVKKIVQVPSHKASAIDVDIIERITKASSATLDYDSGLRSIKVQGVQTAVDIATDIINAFIAGNKEWLDYEGRKRNREADALRRPSVARSISNSSQGAYPSPTVAGFGLLPPPTANPLFFSMPTHGPSHGGGGLLGMLPPQLAQFVNNGGQGPPVLPENWFVAYDGEGKAYFYNSLTNETSWTPPLPPHVEEKIVPITERPAMPAIQGVGRDTLLSSTKEPSPPPSPAKPSTEKKARKFKKLDLTDSQKECKIQVSEEVVGALNRYRKADCPVGRITNESDFKNLARKLTHTIVEKELKLGGSLQVTDAFKHKIKNFIKEYMKKFGELYVPSE